MARIAAFVAYWLQTLAAVAFAPVMRVTGFRFDKSWRGNPWINHAQANGLADGYKPTFMKFFNRFI